MRISDILAICGRNLARRKLRTFLTALGIVIGVALIIVAISIGIGLQETYDAQLQQWGDLTMIEIYNYGWNGSDSVLDDEAIARIQALDGVDVATPFYQTNVYFQIKTKNERYVAYGDIYGVYPDALEKLGYKLKEGEYLKTGDQDYSIVAGEYFAYQFRDVKRGGKNNSWRDPYPDENGVVQDPFVDLLKDRLILYAETQKYDDNGNPIGEDMEIVPKITGVLQQSDQHWEASYSCFMDISELQALEKKYNRLNGNSTKTKVNYTQAKVKCVDVDSVESVQDAIEAMGYNCSSMNDSREYMQEQANAIQLVLGGLSAFSLLVAAIGIANTMYMSIYERTREIGVMKVIGAQLGNIRMMFLAEAGMIGLIGGAMGVGLSLGGSYLLNRVAGSMLGTGGRISVIPVWLIMLALVFSIFVGILFGFLPANRAVKISALEAIKHD